MKGRTLTDATTPSSTPGFTAGSARASGSRRPLIAVTANDPARTADPALTERKTELYLDAVRRAGGDAVSLHAGTPPDVRARVLAGMNGLLLSGGPDIDPAFYGEPIAGAVEIDALRDALDLEAWREAERRALPVLGICRGLQAVNVFSGGRLVQDVPDHTGFSYGRGPTARHQIEVDPKSRLGHLLGIGDGAGGRVTVNTFHHQAVQERGIAPGLVASAWADSRHGRIVEGLEGLPGRGTRWIVAVQCHPERTDSTPSEFDGLFRALVEAATSHEK